MTDTLRIHANIDISAETLRIIVENARDIVGRNAKGHYRIDTAELASAMISRFLAEKDFESYVSQRENYAFFEARPDR